jgi:hypothetical protein
MVELIIKSRFDEAGVKKAEAAMRRLNAGLPQLAGESSAGTAGVPAVSGGGLPDASGLDSTLNSLNTTLRLMNSNQNRMTESI